MDVLMESLSVLALGRMGWNGMMPVYNGRHRGCTERTCSTSSFEISDMPRMQRGDTPRCVQDHRIFCAPGLVQSPLGNSGQYVGCAL